MTLQQTTSTLLSPAEADLRYFAGLFDGEGSVNISKSSLYNTCRLEISIVNTNKNVLLQAQEIFGVGRVRIHSYGKHLTCYAWSCYAENARKVLELLQPYLVIKYDVCRYGLEFLQIRLDKDKENQKLELREEIRRINRET